LIMGAIFDRDDVPSHLFTIPELDFSGDLFVDRIAGLWFRLGAHTINHRRDGYSVEDVVLRQSLLFPIDAFSQELDRLESVGNVLGRIGTAGGSVSYIGDEKHYSYSPFYRLDHRFASASPEPLVFVYSNTTPQLFVHPDLWLFLELEERTPGAGIWWDPRRGTDALIRHVSDDGNLEILEIRTDHLLRYLQARQMSLVVGHYRHLHLYHPSAETKESFVEENVTVENANRSSKAIIQNWTHGDSVLPRGEYLQRRLHLWFEIKPPEIDIDDPWTEAPPLDPYTFTLPTGAGAVAPARWAHFRLIEGRKFEGEPCDFMRSVFFRQEVLIKYQGASGFSIEDDGSVVSKYYWALNRSTVRVGNELLSTAIGDFAESVPFEEWPHWKQYAVEPPGRDSAKAIREETTIPDAVNALVESMQRLNVAFRDFAASLGVDVSEGPWQGSSDSLAGRQLKWVYPANADDDEFLKRATLASTLIVDGLDSSRLRQLLQSVAKNLHQTFDNPPRSLWSRNLLQRVALVSAIIVRFRPEKEELLSLLHFAEGKSKSPHPDLQTELEAVYHSVRDEFAPIAFLYDLRIYGGLAHPPNKEKAGLAAAELGLPKESWHRRDYLSLLQFVSQSVHQITARFEGAADIPIS
jgi:hypothetical protein